MGAWNDEVKQVRMMDGRNGMEGGSQTVSEKGGEQIGGWLSMSRGYRYRFQAWQANSSRCTPPRLFKQPLLGVLIHAIDIILRTSYDFNFGIQPAKRALIGTFGELLKCSNVIGSYLLHLSRLFLLSVATS
jgi:hypothetical protein